MKNEGWWWNSATNSAFRKQKTDEWQSGVMGSSTNTYTHTHTQRHTHSGILCSWSILINVVTCTYTFNAKHDRYMYIYRDVNQAQKSYSKTEYLHIKLVRCGCDILTEEPIFLFRLSVSNKVTGNTQSPETHHFLSSVLSVKSLPTVPALKALQKYKIDRNEYCKEITVYSVND